MQALKSVLLPLILLLSGLFACNSNSEKQPKTEFAGIQEVQPIKADQINPLVTTFSGEKAVLMNIWATWCIPCVEEFPYLVRLQKEYQDELQVVFISADFPEEIDRIHSFLTDNQVDWQTYIKDDRDEPFIDAVWTKWSGALPATVVYNKDGSRLTAFERPATYDEFKELVLKAIQNS
jgi:thiol-disulfide isomerase/thioredoxin